MRGSAPHISLAIDSKYSPPTGFVRISLRLSSEGIFLNVSRLRLAASVTRSLLVRQCRCLRPGCSGLLPIFSVASESPNNLGALTRNLQSRANEVSCMAIFVPCTAAHISAYAVLSQANLIRWLDA